MYPIFVRIAAKKEKAYIKTMYEIPDLSQWYNGKVVARTDAAMMNKRLLFELKKYNDRVNAIENNDTYTATQLKLIVIQADKVAQNTSTFTDFFRKKIEELKKDGRENYAKMHEETLRIFLLSEGEAPFVIMNHITVEHFDTYMKRKGYSDGNRNIRLSHIKARVNEAIKYGLIKCEKHPFAYTGKQERRAAPNARKRWRTQDIVKAFRRTRHHQCQLMGTGQQTHSLCQLSN